jgi:hypothetical protein
VNTHQLTELRADRDEWRRKCERVEKALRTSTYDATRWRQCAERLRQCVLGDTAEMRNIALAEFDRLSSAPAVTGEPSTGSHDAHRQHAGGN